MTPILAWHFLPDDGRTERPHGRGGRRRVVVGRRLIARGPLVMCLNGLHASLRPLDALRYAQGAQVCRVEVGGEVLLDDDKVCARWRRVLALADATRTLHEVAVEWALQVLQREREAGREPDTRLWTALDVKQRWIRGEASEGDLVAAGNAAKAAEQVAEQAIVGDAAWDAWDAAWVAEQAAMGTAAWTTAWTAAQPSGGDTEQALARAAQDADLERRLLALLGLSEVTVP